MLEMFRSDGNFELDTARMYCKGETEVMLGELLTEDDSLVVASKCFPFPARYPHSNLEAANIAKQIDDSLAALKKPSVDLIYLHAPDPTTPIEETLKGINKAFLANKFKRFGLSNYQAWEVAHIWHLCKANYGFLPTVYQGMYNSMTRDVERELLPCLRRLNIAFYAYNPLAGGLLTGKLQRDAKPEIGSRFDSNEGYRTRYLKEVQFDACDIIFKACQDNGDIPPAHCALRWIKHHSQLSSDNNDAVIIGASKVAHLKDNLAALKGGPLPQPIIDACDQAWLLVKQAAACPSYERGTSKL